MAQSFVQVPPDGAGKEVDTFITDTAAHHRQLIAIADPAVDANIVPISTRLRLPVESEVQADFDTGAGTENISLVGIALPASGGAVVGGTSTNPFIVTATGTVPLPTGAATEATLAALNAKVTAVNTGAVVVASSALPTGASTEAKQDTGNTSLASIDGKITAVNTGAVVVASSALPTGASTEAKQDTQITALAAIQTAVEILDDWDESDRAKVNPIAGQAGVQGASGTVTALTQRVVLATDVALPAGANLIGRASASHETSTIYDGTTAKTPKFAVIDVASSGDNTLVAAVASNKIRVLALFLVSAGTVNVRFESGAGGTALTGQMNLIANTGFVLPFNPVGWFETAVNTLLNLELSGAISVDGSLVYVEVP